MTAATALPNLLLIAWLLPLASFTLVCVGFSIAQLAGRPVSKSTSKIGAYVATAAIVSGFVCSVIALVIWIGENPLGDAHGAGHDDGHHHASVTRPHNAPLDDAKPVAASPFQLAALHDDQSNGDHDHADHDHAHDDHADGHTHGPEAITGEWYTLAQVGKLRLTIGYYIDALTVTMFCMVTLIASCVHFYAIGYMHDELTDEWTDPEVTLRDGEPLTRRGRFHRFFQFLSLFCFSMLGVVVSGNMAMTFVFWELVGICSYFLIGFYIERKSASTAANKAFIVNRVGDFGMLIGMMVLWSSVGTFSFGDKTDADGNVEQGLFSLVRPEATDHALAPPDGMVQLSARDEVAKIVLDHPDDPEAAAAEVNARTEVWRSDEEHRYGHWLLFVAGVGIFCGCVGKSAQFPLHVWLPDAMEGPTPVSALVHSATMVAAGVFLVGRFYPVFTPEALLVIAYIGCITLFVAATIAITATDIKRVLAYSTVSQLGYMMLALGLGGWVAGLFHLITHAFFKGLLFLCSGSVIHAVHSNEMTDMGGLRKKMPITAYTMLIGCLAIAGAGVPFLVGFSGYYSKDAILEHGFLFMTTNPSHGILFLAAAAGAAITAFYMFRLWYMTFAGEPRDAHRYAHAHESPRTMTTPLIILAFFAVAIGWPIFGVTGLLEQARPAGTLAESAGVLMSNLVIPNEHESHAWEIKKVATTVAFTAALAGFMLATIMYAWKLLDPEEVRRQFRGVYRFLRGKWWFDELYNFVFVQPTLFLSRRIAQIDLGIIDGFVHALSSCCKKFANLWDAIVDRGVVDGSLNLAAEKTWDLGLSLRRIQTGSIRQYVMFIAVAAVALFVLITFVWNFAMAG